MSNKIFPISYCFAAYNEEEIIEDTVTKLKIKLNKKFGPRNYEIVIVENGSTDNTTQILKKIKYKNLRVLHAPVKSHGIAMKMAIENAKYDHIVITGADLPFAFSDLTKAFKYWNKYDIVFGSKLHPDSDYPTNSKRKLSSNIYSRLLNLFFKIGVRDVQGSIFLRRSKIVPFLKYCDAETAFFTTQLAIYARLFKLTLYEIPVKRGVSLTEERKSKYSVSKDGTKMLIAIFKEYVKYNKMRQLEKNSMV